MEIACLSHSRFVIIDVETTGFDAGAARVVEIAWQVVQGGAVVESFESLVDPRCPIPAIATGVHGIGDADVIGMPTLEMLRPRLERALSGSVVVAHNLAFERRFLPVLDRMPGVCSWRLAARLVPEAPNHKNQTLGRFFAVTDPALAGRRAHRALADVIVTRHIFAHCLDRYLRAGYPDRIDALVAFAAERGATRVTPASGRLSA